MADVSSAPAGLVPVGGAWRAGWGSPAGRAGTERAACRLRPQGHAGGAGALARILDPGPDVPLAVGDWGAVWRRGGHCLKFFGLAGFGESDVPLSVRRKSIVSSDRQDILE